MELGALFFGLVTKMARRFYGPPNYESNKSHEKKDDCKRNHFKKKSDEAMHDDQSSWLSTDTLSRKRSQSPSRSSSRSCSCSHSCLSSRSYGNHHVSHDDHKPSALPNCGHLYSSKRDDGGCIHCPDKSNTVFATFSAPTAKRGKCTHK